MTALTRLPLGLQLLLHAPRRLVASAAGITLAVVLMFLQTGFRQAMFDSQTELIHQLNGELMIVSRLKYLTYVPDPFPSARISQARTVAGVKAACPLYVENLRSVWKNARFSEDGGWGLDGEETPERQIRVLAFNPRDEVFDFPAVRRHADELLLSSTVLFDDRSRGFYGHPQAGTKTELAGRRVEVIDTFSLGTDFLSDGSVIMSDHTFLTIFRDRALPEPHLDKVDVGVVRLREGADILTVQEGLRRALPDDVVVLTKAELAAMENAYWRDHSPIGFVFTLGMLVGFAIGVGICYQVLYSNVSHYLPQFAALKAMGFTNWYVRSIVVAQAIALAILGFVPAVGAAQLLFGVVGSMTGLVMFLPPLPSLLFRLGLVFVLTVAMCLVAGIMAMRRVVTTDPVEVFR